MASKPVIWGGSSLVDLREFPANARSRAGYQLHRIQQGLMPSDWKPMASKKRSLTANVFRDLGFDLEESENLKIRADLMIELSELIEKRGWIQARAAEVMGVSQPRISDLVCGKIDRFSIDTLIAMLGSAGVKVWVTTALEPH